MPEHPKLDSDLRLALAEINNALFRQSVCLKALTDMLTEKGVVNKSELSSAIVKLSRETKEEMKKQSGRGPRGVQ